MGLKRQTFVCSVCGIRLQRALSRSATGTVYLGMDGKPHKHEGTLWEPIVKEEDISLT